MFKRLVRSLSTTTCRCYSGGGRRLPRVDEYKDPWKIIKSELRGHTKGVLQCPREIDVLIIGGGGIGSSVAYWLKQLNPRGFTVAVIERDSTYTRASTTLSAGGLRQQFSQAENIQMSMFTAEFLRKHKEYLVVEGEPPPDVQFNPGGYLFVADSNGAEGLKKKYDLYMSEGAKVKLLTASQVKEKFPWLNTDDVELATYGTQNEGWFDGWSLLQGLRQKATSLGAQYINGEVIGFDHENVEYIHSGKRHMIDSPRHALVKLPSGDIQPVKFAACVVCAGAWAGEVARMAGIGNKDTVVQELTVPLPVEPRKRYVFVTHCPNGPGLEMPFVIDTRSGLAVRREGLGNMYLSCLAPSEEEEPSIDNLDVDYDYFEQKMWPQMAHRIPVMENLKVKHSWAGYYDYNYVDQNLIIGQHPFFKQIFFANGSSGHGLQHIIPIGRALMELIVHGEYRTIDLSRLDFKRFLGVSDIDLTETAVY